MSQSKKNQDNKKLSQQQFKPNYDKNEVDRILYENESSSSDENIENQEQQQNNFQDNNNFNNSQLSYNSTTNSNFSGNIKGKSAQNQHLSNLQKINQQFKNQYEKEFKGLNIGNILGDQNGEDSNSNKNYSFSSIKNKNNDKKTENSSNRGSLSKSSINQKAISKDLANEFNFNFKNNTNNLQQNQKSKFANQYDNFYQNGLDDEEEEDEEFLQFAQQQLEKSSMNTLNQEFDSENKLSDKSKKKENLNNEEENQYKYKNQNQNQNLNQAHLQKQNKFQIKNKDLVDSIINEVQQEEQMAYKDQLRETQFALINDQLNKSHIQKNKQIQQLNKENSIISHSNQTQKSIDETESYYYDTPRSSFKQEAIEYRKIQKDQQKQQNKGGYQQQLLSLKQEQQEKIQFIHFDENMQQAIQKENEKGLQIQKQHNKKQINPLDIIEADEENTLYQQNMDKKNEEFERELILEKIEPQKYHKNMFFYPLEQISFTTFQESFGFPKCIIGYPDKYVIIGTSKTYVIVFDMHNPRNFQILDQNIAKLDQKSQGSVICFDISQDGTMLAAGYEFGDIIFWNLTNFSQIKNKFQIVALVSTEIIILLSLYPKVKLLHKFTKPSQIRLGSIPQFSFQPFKERNKYNVYDDLNPGFSIGWGCLIRFYRFNQNLIELLEDGIKQGDVFDISSHIITDHSSVHLEFISQQMLIQINTRNEIKLFYINDFVLGDHKQSEKFDLVLLRDNKNYQKCIKFNKKLDYNIEFQSFLQDTQGNARISYINTFSTQSRVNDIYILCDKMIYRGHLNRWSETVYSFIQSQKWHDALKLCSELYHTKITMFSNRPCLENEEGRKDFEQTISDILSIYIQQNQQKFEQAQKEGYDVDFMWNQLCITCIEFCVNIQKFNILFKEVRNFFFINEKNKMFLSNLEYFINNGFIKEVPSHMFTEIIYFYKQQNKLSVLQKFIISLDINSIDVGYTIPLCLEAHLYTPLTYICAKKKIDQSKQQTRAMLIYKQLWFIRNSFNGIIFPNEYIEDEKRKVVIRQIIVWIFVPEIQQEFVKADSSTFFGLLFELFRNKFIKSYLKNFDKELFEYFKEEIEREEEIKNQQIQIEGVNNNINGSKLDQKNQKDNKNEHDEGESSDDNVTYKMEGNKVQGINQKQRKEQQTVQQMKQKHYPGMFHKIIIRKIYEINQAQLVTYPQVKINFAILVGKICQDKDFQQIDLDICIKAIEILLQFSINAYQIQQDSKKIENTVQTNFEKRNRQFYEQAVNQLPLELRETLILNILQMKEKELLQQNELVNDLISECDQIEQLQLNSNISEQFDETMAYLNYLDKNYLPAFNLYLLMAQRKNKVYELFFWLNEAYRNNPDFVENFEKNIIQNMKELVMLHSQLAKNFVVKLLYNKISEIQEVLTEYPPLLLDFMEKLLEDRKKIHFDEDFLLTYVSLLSKYAPEKVIKEIEEYPDNYNLKQVLQLCQINSALEPQAYILQKLGNLQEAFDLYLEQFNQVSQKALDRINKRKSFDTNIIRDKFNNLLNICINMSDKSDDYNNTLAQWYKLANKVLQKEEKGGFWQEVSNFDGYSISSGQKKLQLVFADILADMFLKIMQYTSLKEVISIITTYQSSLALKDVRYSLVKVFKDYQAELTINSETEDMLKTDIIKNKLLLIKLSLKGFSFSPICDLCQGKISENNSGVSTFKGYNCNHIFHQICLNKYIINQQSTQNNQKNVDQCPKCQKRDKPAVYQMLLSYQKKQDILKNKNIHHEQRGVILRDKLTSVENDSNKSFDSPKQLGQQKQSNNNKNNNVVNNQQLEGKSSQVFNSDSQLLKNRQSQNKESIQKIPVPGQKSHFNVSRIRANLKEKMLRKLQVYDAINEEYHNNLEYYKQYNQKIGRQYNRDPENILENEFSM
ncbi:WD40-repeat-containing domain [Pseudocohnilembus persalinus]|uniref:WD40-repeat-containing domain n=1 Tax=Pseudocohnilembus persalinus TaxID=266149 RepID=A0A0V0QKR2_PSEPJ|nr:WD40-repeat-containing domain [Pseudocohnilembus persalinus]|eukprot:KRX02804.1 WD40-repeat-containing domain [Pseudocohnilembus persalinus]